jgi:hypothetical protein
MKNQSTRRSAIQSFKGDEGVTILPCIRPHLSVHHNLNAGGSFRGQGSVVKSAGGARLKIAAIILFQVMSVTMLFGQTPSADGSEKQFQYLSPRPGSTLINIEHNIIIREGSAVEFSSLNPGLFSIRGSKNGLYEFGMVLAKDGKTILLNPSTPFGYDEVVSISVNKGIKTKDGRVIGAYSFSFKTHREYTTEERQKFKELSGVTEDEAEIKEGAGDVLTKDESETRGITGMFEITTNNNPTAGAIFFNATSRLGVITPFNGYYVINSDGDSIYSKALDYAGVFQKTNSGYFVVVNGDQERFDVLDSNFNVIDKYYPANGYGIDNHDFLMQNDGHVLIIARELQVVDMTVYNPDYSPNATVEGTVIQEFDEDKNLIFEWRSFDHIEITEALHSDLSYTYIDYVHTNSLDIDNDGNILASQRHLDQITKIDRNTGEFIWRWGGLKNEFTFINEPEPFTFQHDCHRISNGNITLFDNGNYHSPKRSYAKEYQLDEINKTAMLVWSYSHPDVNGVVPYYFAKGSVQRLDNGNTFIDWGNRPFGTTFLPSMSEINTANEIIWELVLTSADNIIAYRAHKYLWDPCTRVTFNRMKIKNITDHSARLKWEPVANAVEYGVQYSIHNDNSWITKTVDASKHQLNLDDLEPATTYDWQMKTICDINTGKSSGYTAIKKFKTLTLRSFELNEKPPMDLQLYPNPAYDQINIEVSNTSISQVSLLNLLGQEIRNVPITGDESLIQFPIGDVPSGTYLLEIIGNQQKEVRKLVLLH